LSRKPTAGPAAHSIRRVLPGKALLRRTVAVTLSAAACFIVAVARPARRVQPLTLHPSALSLAVGTEYLLHADLKQPLGEKASCAIGWRTQNADIATVDDSGLVRGVGVGMTGIVAQCGAAHAIALATVSAAPAFAAPTRAGLTESARLPTARVHRAPVPAGRPNVVISPHGGQRDSPHFSHISVFYTDFFTSYRPPAERKAVVDFMARRVDGVMSGGSALWKAANPTIKTFPYSLLYSVKLAGQGDRGDIASVYSADMQRWYASHPQYQYERAFLHRGGADSAHRAVLKLPNRSHRWVVNPGDPGLRAYQIERYRALTAGSSGAFLDEFGGNLQGASNASDEYPSRSAYFTSLTELVSAIRQAISPKLLLMNIAEYWNPTDSMLAVAAGAVQLERTNFPFGDHLLPRWSEIDHLLAAGVYVEFVSFWSYTDWVHGPHAFPTLSRGMYSSVVERGQIAQLASYYMVVPQDAHRLWFDQQNMWNVRPDSVWMPAIEYDIGHPTGARRVIASGVDPRGQHFRVFARDFDRALVLIRPSSDWRPQVYGDDTGVEIKLPAPMRLLRRDGTLGPPVAAVTLRNVEAAILIR